MTNLILWIDNLVERMLKFLPKLRFFVVVFLTGKIWLMLKELRNSLQVSCRETKVSLVTEDTASSAIQIYNWGKCDVALLLLYVSEECLPSGKADRIKTSRLM